MESMVECDMPVHYDVSNVHINSFHTLNDKWTLWAHLPHDTDWSLNSYKNVMTFNTVEDTIALYDNLQSQLVKNCMLFLMRDGVRPTWEDPRNKNGGSFSYKILNKEVQSTWRQLSFMLVGESLTKNMSLMKNITGVTISPKKNFCIIKIWISNCEYKNPSVINAVSGLSSHGCIFKRHNPTN